MNKYYTPKIRIEIDGCLADDGATIMVARAIIAHDRAEQKYLRTLSQAFSNIDPFN